MQELVIASNNKGKLNEIRQLIPGLSLMSLADLGYTEAIPEPYDTFEENALTKASTIFQYCNKNTFADDSGICAHVLNGAPGVRSARYAGEGATDEDNLKKLLQELEGHEDRSGHYKAVVCLLWKEQPYFFEGVCEGTIIDSPKGEGGFGYDPVFVPHGYTETFAELAPNIKNEISHRGKAVRKMVAFIKEQLESTDEIFDRG